MTSTRETQWTQPWFRRRAVYSVVGVVLLIAAGFGLIDEGQIDAVAASPILGTLLAFVAAAKTNPGSDSTVTAKDVAEAASASDQIRQQVQDAVAGAVAGLPDNVRQAVEGIYNAPYGQHDHAAPSTVAAYYAGES